MKHFSPFKIYSSPTRSTIVFNPATSLPAEGSVRAKAEYPPSAIIPKYFFFCSSLPPTRMGYNANELASTEVVILHILLPVLLRLKHVKSYQFLDLQIPLERQNYIILLPLACYESQMEILPFHHT